MSAITHVLDGIIVNRNKISWRHVPEVGSLVITLVWMANALANRPADGGTWNVVRDSGSVHHVNEHGEAAPHRPLSYYALHSLRNEPVHRLSSLRTIDEITMLRLVSTKNNPATTVDLFLMLNPVVDGAKDIQAVDWNDEPAQPPTYQVQPASNNKRRKVNLQPSNDVPQVFGPGEGQIAIPGLSAEQEAGYASEEEDPEQRVMGAVSHEELSELVNQVAVQIFDRAPNHARSGHSYCLLSPLQKLEVTNAIFESRDSLATTWRAYTLFTDLAKWENTVKRLFPTRAEYQTMMVDRHGNPTQPQGLYAMAFWKSWQNVLNRAPPGTEEHLVQGMRKYINRSWRWFPAIEGGKLWNTGKKPKQQHYGDLENGPWIACNPRLSH